MKLYYSLMKRGPIDIELQRIPQESAGKYFPIGFFLSHFSSSSSSSSSSPSSSFSSFSSPNKSQSLKTTATTNPEIDLKNPKNTASKKKAKRKSWRILKNPARFRQSPTEQRSNGAETIWDSFPRISRPLPGSAVDDPSIWKGKNNRKKLLWFGDFKLSIWNNRWIILIGIVIDIVEFRVSWRQGGHPPPNQLNWNDMQIDDWLMIDWW